MGPFWKWKARYIPDSGRKNEIIVTRIISPHHPFTFSAPSFFSSPLVEVFAFLRR